MGWIRRRPDRPSPWRAGYRAPDGRERSKSFKRKVDAERWLRDQVGNVDRGSWVDPGAGKVTFAEVAEQWLAGRRARPSTIARDESILRYRILPALGPRAVGSLAPSDLEGWLSGLEDELAPSTVRKAWALAGSVLRLAVRDGLIARTPARDVELPALVAPEPRFITADQVLALTDAIGPQWRAVVLLGGLGGLRFGEMAGLQVADLDLLRRRVTIRRTASDVRGKVIVGPPKTRKALRTITVPQVVADALAARLEGVTSAEAFVFADSKGGPIRRTGWVRRVWNPAVKAAGFEGLTPHDLRHSHVAILIDQGEHPRAIADRLGHTSVRTVLDVYGHLFPDADAGIAGRLDDMLDSGAAHQRPKPESAAVTDLAQARSKPR
jgi:integrase